MRLGIKNFDSVNVFLIGVGFDDAKNKETRESEGHRFFITDFLRN